jgi:hypothetical protein
MNLDVKNCRSCEAPIVWCRTRSGKSMPVDADPVERGEFYLVEGDDGKLEAHHVGSSAEGVADDADRYTSHFATCENAAQHRKPR